MINPWHFNLIGFIQKPVVDTTNETVTTWETVYENVYMRRLAPPRGREGQSQNQTVGTQLDSWHMWKGDMYIELDYRLIQNDRIFYITGERPFQSSLDQIVLDTEVRDNQPRLVTDTSEIAIQDPDGNLVEKT